ncbi:ABC transporter permease [Marinicellulosiphila megalodicopiae]|uniref:ABC transporter permease n=1 Tax=Marinicellulosiphila megalodicopiae TaxID=2724896 RepID=UPI003BAF98DA
MKFYLRIYGLIIAQHFKSKMAYRVDFFISIIGMIGTQFVSLFALWVLFQSIETIENWNKWEILFLYGFAQFAMLPAQVCLDHCWQLGNHLQSGTFLKYYMRPLNSLFYFLSEVFDVKAISQLISGIICTAIAVGNMEFEWIGLDILLYVYLLFFASFIYTSMLMLASTTAFWITASNPVLQFTHRLRDYSHFPMSVFSDGFKFLFTFVLPIGLIAYYPVNLILNGGSVLLGVIALTIASIAFISLAYYSWVKGTARYEGTGS